MSSDPLCATCGISIYEDGWYTETRGEYGHDCDGTEAMCARRCPIEVPVEVQVPCHPAQPIGVVFIHIDWCSAGSDVPYMGEGCTCPSYQ